jgi:hypothetical protein
MSLGVGHSPWVQGPWTMTPGELQTGNSLKSFDRIEAQWNNSWTHQNVALVHNIRKVLTDKWRQILFLSKSNTRNSESATTGPSTDRQTAGRERDRVGGMSEEVVASRLGQIGGLDSLAIWQTCGIALSEDGDGFSSSQHYVLFSSLIPYWRDTAPHTLTRRHY